MKYFRLLQFGGKRTLSLELQILMTIDDNKVKNNTILMWEQFMFISGRLKIVLLGCSRTVEEKVSLQPAV